MSLYRAFLNRFRQWDPVTAVTIVLFGYFISQVFGALVFVVVAGISGQTLQAASGQLKDSPWLALVFGLCIYGFYLLIVCTYLRWTSHSWRDIGLKITQKWWEIIGYVVIGYGLYFLALITAMTIIKNYVPKIDLDQKQKLGIDTNIAGRGLIPIFITLVIVPPIVEEIITRGFLFGGLRSKLPIVWAGLITSIIFASAHLEWGGTSPPLWAAAIDTFILSVVLIYLRVKTDSLYPAIGLHMLKNLFAFLGLFVFHLARW